MRKIFIPLFVVVLSIFISTSLILAKDGSEGSGGANRLNTVGLNLKENRAELVDQRQELKDQFKEQEASRMAEVKAKVQQNLTKRLSNIARHLGAYLERLDKIAAKIDSRIVKIKAKGVDTTKAESKLAEAKVLGTQAKAAIDAANADIANAKDKASVTTAMASIRSAQKALFAYHKGLVATLVELKVANGLVEGSGSAKESGK